MTASNPDSYRGRFAPTPSGPLHLGSLAMAAASWLDARHHGGSWQLRIDDIDPPREQPGAADLIRQQLEQFALHWDGPVLYQSQHATRYQEAVDQLIAGQNAFFCNLSRKDLDALGNQHPGLPAAVPPGPDLAVRARVCNNDICLDDAVAGRYCENLQATGGAFVIRRRDGLYAYQLACAVDDGGGQITHVLRGDDLLASTPRQIWLMQLLSLSVPHYAHLPVLRDSQGNKLAKSIGSASISDMPAAAAMHLALAHLGLHTDASAPPATQLEQARVQWHSPFAAVTRAAAPQPGPAD